jgi:hypothetical protein
MFLHSAGVLLVATALAKLMSSFGSAPILLTSDPILVIPFRYVFWLVGGIEMSVAALCFWGRKPWVAAAFVAWLASAFVLYRLGLIAIGYARPCTCLGNLTDALHLSPAAANSIMVLILAYLFVGSYGSLVWLWTGRKQIRIAIAIGSISVNHDA